MVLRLLRVGCLVAVVGSIWNTGCVTRTENEVVVYTSVDREFASPILDKFQRDHVPCEVVRQFDIESTKTVGLVTRLMEEQQRTRCDVFWNNEILHTIRLQKAGLLETHRWQVPQNWPSGYMAKDKTWIGFAARARVLLINTQKLADRAEWPRSVRELAEAKWQGNCGMALPLFGTTATHFAVLYSQAPEAQMEWFRRVAKNSIVLSGNKQVAQAVSSGQIAWGLTDTDDAMVEKENGMPVVMIFPDQEADQPGSLLIPNTIALLKKSPHPSAARQLADYLIEPQTEERLTMGNASQFRIWPGDHAASTLAEFTDIKRMEVDFEKAAETWDTLAPLLRELFQQGK